MAGELVYRVNGTSAVTMATSTLEAAGLRERQHLQEWVLATPEILGEDVLIVTSEFDQWFSKEGRDPDRLDVLGLGQDGRLVVAELKRDLTPDLVTMQAINYAARASRFTPDIRVVAENSTHSALTSSPGVRARRPNSSLANTTMERPSGVSSARLDSCAASAS